MMRSTFFWLLAFGGFAAVSLLCGLLVWPQLSAAWPSIEEKIDRFRRQPPLVKLVLLLFVGAFVVYGSTKTNLVDQTSGTNIVEIVEGGTNDVVIAEGETNGVEIVEGGTNDVTEIDSESDTNEVDVAEGDTTNTPPMMLMMTKPSFGDNSPTVTPEDIARGWQLWEVRTNSNVCYTMPEGATLASNWWVRGAFEDCSIVRLGDCSIGGYVSQSNNLNNPNNQTMSFPFGTNEYSSLWAFSWGKLRFELGNTNTEIVAVGAPMSAVPYRSRLWSAADTNGARVVTWENFALNRGTNTPVNAQVELRTTGDFIVRSNEIEKVYHRIDDFDWDGDGIPNWSDWAPYWYDGDYTGQEDWWREYVDEMVGTGLENGYYKLTATFPQEGFRRTVLNVGVNEIVVAEPGEYVFLLEKGNSYDIGLEPFADGVAFEAVDDIPGPMPRLFAGLEPSWTGRWSEDPGRCILEPPTVCRNGHVLWMPKLRVSPGVWSPAGDSPSEDFEAELHDQTGSMGETTYHWQSCHDSLEIDSPYWYTTEMTWRGNGQVAGTVARLEVCVAGEQLESELRFGFRGSGESDDEDDPEISVDFAMSVPEALLLNSNEVLSAKIGQIRMNLRGTIPSNGTLVLRPTTGSECVRFTAQASWTVTPASVRTGVEHVTYIEGVQAGSSLEDVELEAVLVFPNKERVCGRSRLTVIEVGGVIFIGEPDGRPVVAPSSWVPFGMEISPAEATPLVWTEYAVRHQNEAGEFSGWQWVGYGDTDTTECGFRPTSRGVWQVRGTVGLEREGCPYGTDVRDTLFGSDEPAYVYVPREPRLVFDYDRDGVIGTNDVAKTKDGNTTFRFWINDDNDSGDTNDSANDIPGSGSNYSDGQVNGRGDLLDFTPVWMDFSEVFPTGTPAQVWGKVEWRLSSTCVNVVWSNLGRENAGSFQREQDLYEFGPQLYDLPECADVTCIANGVVIPHSLRGTAETEGGVFLIEGWSPGFDLALEGWRANRSQNEQEWLVTSEADICITDVEDMYRFASLRGAAEDPALTVDVPALPPNRPEGAKDLDVFFTHGFNVNAGDARAWGSEVFKRLWQSGSNANFHMLPWRGDYRLIDQSDLTTDLSALHYQHNAWFAQRTGGALKRYVEAAQPVASKRILMTQSLGNMVACEVLREGLQVGQYYMFDAAIPSEAIDETLRAETQEDEAFAKYVPSAWHDYTNACWAANWHRFFEDDPTDARGKMGWANRFQDALANAAEVFNYYSSGDSVFTEASDTPSLFSGVTHWGIDWYLGFIPCPTVEITFDNHSWQKQEVLKGAARVAGTLSGGWGFHVGLGCRYYVYDLLSGQLETRFTPGPTDRSERFYVLDHADGVLIPVTESELTGVYHVSAESIVMAQLMTAPPSANYSSKEAEEMVLNGSVTNNPIFDVSGAQEMMNLNATDDDVFLALAKHVPALSSPVGGNPVFSEEKKNFDLNNGDYRNGWGRNHSVFGSAWLHSDMKDMAYFYVYKLYEQLISKGNLK